MPVYNIPKVYTSEIDLTTNVSQAGGSSYAALVGEFQWGPCETPILLTSENDLVDVFGKPTDNTYISFFSASNFLTYSSSLKLVRVVDTTTAKNATAGNTSVLVKNASAYDSANLVNTGAFISKYPGTLGNSLFIACCDSSANLSSNVYSDSTLGTWGNYFITLPGTSDHATAMGGSKDELHILVFDKDGGLSGTKGQLLEKYQAVSKAPDAKKEGVTNFYMDLINNNSKYLKCGDVFVLGANSTASVANSFSAVATGNASFTLTKGTLGSVANSGSYITGYQLFTDKKNTEVSHFITANVTSTVVSAVIDVAEGRSDSVVYVSPRYVDLPCGTAGLTQSQVANNCIDYKVNSIARSSSYYVMDNNWAYQYDKYNDTFRWIPCNSHTAGLSARTDNNAYTWSSPAGYTRGLLSRVNKLAWNPQETYIGQLYGYSINSIVLDETNGIVLMGDKTGLIKSSAFDRIGVRKLFNALKKSISAYLKYMLFEVNDEFTRAQITSMINAYLNQVKGLRGIFEFQVVCNATNNTAEVIDSNTLVCDIYIKPTKSINYIQLNMIAVGSAVNFNEYIGRV